MNETENNTSIGEALRRIKNGDLRRQIYYDEESGDFKIRYVENNEIEEPEDANNDGYQNVTNFAEEGFAII